MFGLFRGIAASWTTLAAGLLGVAAASAAELVSPAGVPFASGPAFPLGRDNARGPDAQYAAEKAIDGNPGTFCCLLDDTLDGETETTIPAKAAAPVTGHVVFDLGQPVEVSGARLTGRAGTGGRYMPRDVDFYRFADHNPEGHRTVDDIENDDGIVLLASHTFLGAAAVAFESVAWKPVKVRYVGMRVNSSYESGSGGVHYNFQIGEIEFSVPADSAAARAKVAARLTAWREDAAKLRAAVEDLALAFPGRYPSERLLAELEKLDNLVGQLPSDVLTRRLDTLRREALVTDNPLLPERLLFVKRYTYSPGWYYAEFMRASRFGGNLCVLSLADGTVRELVPELDGGIFDRFDLSFDARRAAFGYKSGPGKGFRIWEVELDAEGPGRLRQLTRDPPDEAERIARYWHPRDKPSGVYRHHTDDFHPCYLPDGGICFASTRCERGVLCDQSDSLAVNVLYRTDGDGGNLEMLSEGALSESTPSLTGDGRILYTRWEYVDKGVIAVQALWTMRPDGTGTTEVYGNQIEFPPVLIHARAIPGTADRFVATATMHHPLAVGPILAIDARRDITTHDPIRSLTPDTSLSIEGVGGFPRGENYTHLRGGRWVADNCGPLFADPFPLADRETGAGAGKYFLVTCNPDKTWNDPAAYGLWLIDVFGNRVRIYDDPAISCWQPVPLVPRRRPPVLPSTPKDEPAEATVLLTDVYRGLEGVERGTIEYLRVLEQVARPWSARRFWPNDEAYGQHAPISLSSHIHVKVLHGVVPVDEDGSAHFRVPADRNLFFQALDGDFMEVQRMRTFVNFQPGESRSCVGCHEPRRAPAGPAPLALSHPPELPRPQPGDSGPRPIHYVTDVQPVLDKYCARCHNPKRTDGELDLSGGLTTFFNRSYENLMNKKLVAYIQEFHGPQPRAQKTNVVTLPPMSLGSHASRLIQIIREGHYDCELSREEMIRLVTWADANAPYYGSYFGRRNLIYREHPDFRPVPTLESAMGVPPEGHGE